MVLGQSLALAAERVVAPIEGMHLKISSGWFAATGLPGMTVRRVHDVVSTAVYGSVRIGATVLGDEVDRRVLADSSISVRSRAIVNGLWGDDLGSFEDDLEISMTIRSTTGDVVADGSGSRCISHATSHIVLLVHGLFESESCWSNVENDSGLIEALGNRPHLTVLGVRYNSGRRISDNGEQLSSILEALCADWPVPIESIALVGNSMGGLLIGSACVNADAQHHDWLGNLSDVVTVATPYLGTPIEKGVEILSSAMSLSEATRPLGSFLNSRSEGIKDLRHGSDMVDEFQSAQSIDHHFIAAVVTPDPASLVGGLIGDLVVRPKSAARNGCDATKSVTFVGGTNHFNAVSSPAVVHRVVECLDSGR